MDESTVIPEELLSQEFRLNNIYQIRTKMEGEEGEDIIFEPNIVQCKILQAIEDGWKRIIILKPRKLGVTTLISLYFLDETLYKRNQICRTIAHRLDTAIDLFTDIAQHSFNRLKETSPEILLYDQIAGRTRELAFNNGSAYSIDTESRGKTPTKAHFTEVAYFEDERKFIDSLLSLPKGGLGIFESTANGKGNWFEKEFTRNWQILQSGGTPEIYPMFFAWFDDPNNSERWQPETVLYFPAECAEEKARFNLSDEQILWWDRQKWALGAELPEKFPSTPDEAFIFSTGKVYGAEFRRELNVIPAISFPEYRLTMDYGQTNPLCIQKLHRDRDDNFVVFGELYRSNMPLGEVRKWLELNSADRIKPGGYIEIEYPDPSVFNETQVRNIQLSPGQHREHRYSIADEFRINHKVLLRRGVQNDVMAGIVRMKSYLKFDQRRLHPFRRDSLGNSMMGAPRLFITENCTATISEFDNYRWPKDPAGSLTQHSYEVPLKKNDHAMDALRYGIMTWTQGESDLEEPPPPVNTIAYHLEVARRLDLLEGRVAGSSPTNETY